MPWNTKKEGLRIVVDGLVYFIPIIWAAIFVIRSPFSDFIFSIYEGNIIGAYILAVLVLFIIPIATFFIIYKIKFSCLSNRFINTKKSKSNTDKIDKEDDHQKKIVDLIISAIIGNSGAHIISTIFLVICMFDFSCSVEMIYFGVNYFLMWYILYMLSHYKITILIIKILKDIKIKCPLGKLKFWYNKIYYYILIFSSDSLFFSILYLSFIIQPLTQPLGFFNPLFYYYISIDGVRLIIVYLCTTQINKYKEIVRNFGLI
ncbi:hypothetical protein DRQ26_07275 [bacterium]|nr:MAG: hypothetical protein DRQ26_07275 [bacterium]